MYGWPLLSAWELEGVMMASRFINTKDVRSIQLSRKRLIKGRSTETTLIGKSLQFAGRALKNSLTAQVMELEAQGKSIEEVFPPYNWAGVKASLAKAVESAAL